MQRVEGRKRDSSGGGEGGRTQSSRDPEKGMGIEKSWETDAWVRNWEGNKERESSAAKPPTGRSHPT